MLRYGSVLITGASSGLGRALALACARPGAVLHLSGRDPARLDAVAAEVAARGAAAHPRVLDVADAEAMAAWIAGAGPLDLVVANAGVSAGPAPGSVEAAEQVRRIFAVNLDGVLNTALPALAAMRVQATGPDGVRGRIAAVASFAAFAPAPGAPSYCASKAAVDAWVVATAATARPGGVLMTSVCPGYVRTAMTAENRFPMPGLMDADHAAALVLRGVAAGRRRVAFPWWMAALARVAGALPPAWSAAVLSRAPGKGPMGEGL